MNTTQAIILAIVEGITEYLPISSTGHMIITSSLMGIHEDTFVKNFEIIIQFGAILAVLFMYFKKFLPININFYKRILVAFLPAALIGLLLKNKIDSILGSVQIVAWALIVGGVLLYFSDSWFKNQDQNGKNISDLSLLDCLKLGFIQCFAFIPGVSRSAATILGGLYLKMNKKEAAEFSFFLAVPTLAGATLIKLLKAVKTIDASQVQLLALGTIVSFGVALLAIKFFISLISKHGFKSFGIYRIVLGIIILLYFS